jgi:hypothetical protein
MATYCTAHECKYLGQVKASQLNFESESDFDTFIEKILIPPAQASIDNFCGHNFSNNRGTIRVDGNGEHEIVINPPYVPLLAVNSLTINDDTISASDIKVYDTYITLDSAIFMENQARHQNIVIDISYGYTSVPEDVKYACALVVGNILADMVTRKTMPQMAAAAAAAGSSTFGSGAGRGFTTEVKNLLFPYKYAGYEQV